MSLGWLFCYVSDPYMQDGKCMVDIKARKWVTCILTMLTKINEILRSW